MGVGLIIIDDLGLDLGINYQKMGYKVKKIKPNIHDLVNSVKDFEYVVISWSSSPFLSSSKISDLVRIAQLGYDIVFIPNLPEFMEFEIWNSEFLSEKLNIARLSSASEVKKPLRNLLNSTELDESIYYTQLDYPDIRLFRWNLSPKFYKGLVAFEKLSKYIDVLETSSAELLSIINKDPSIILEVPTFYSIEISGRFVDNRYLPNWRIDLEDMKLENFENLFNQAKETSRNFAFSIGIYNEPMFHENFESILEFVSKSISEGITFILNTSLPYISEKLIETLKSSQNVKGYNDFSSFVVVVDLSSLDEDLFYSMKSGIDFGSVIRNIQELKSKFPKNIFVKVFRNIYNNHRIQEFYLKLKSDGYNVIISRSRLPEINAIDLNLPERIPCYKIQTSIVVLPNGNVPLCEVDTNLSFLLGNVFVESIRDISLKKVNFYSDHVLKNFNNMCEMCKLWDEYDL